MAKNYEAPASVRELEKLMNTFTYKNGFEVSRVFDDWLRFIIFGFDADHQPITEWNYKPEHSQVFMQLTQEWAKVMSNEVNGDNQWFDAFGCLYEAVIAGNGRRSNAGQFFTPEHVCDLMTKLNSNPEHKPIGKHVSDPTCGSGRTLLSFHAHNPGNFMCGEDFDRTCAMMTVCNFLIHGVVGEVVWHDSLQPDSWFDGWKVNTNLNNPMHKYNGIPHVQKLVKEESYVLQHWETIKKKRLEKQAEIVTKQIEVKTEPVIIPVKTFRHAEQLTLF